MTWRPRFGHDISFSKADRLKRMREMHLSGATVTEIQRAFGYMPGSVRSNLKVAEWLDKASPCERVFHPDAIKALKEAGVHFPEDGSLPDRESVRKVANQWIKVPNNPAWQMNVFSYADDGDSFWFNPKWAPDLSPAAQLSRQHRRQERLH